MTHNRRFAPVLRATATTATFILVAVGATSAMAKQSTSVAVLRGELVSAQRAERGSDHPLPRERYRRIAALARAFEKLVGPTETSCRSGLAAAKRLAIEWRRQRNVAADLRRAINGLSHCHTAQGQPVTTGATSPPSSSEPMAPTAPPAGSSAGSPPSAPSAGGSDLPPLSSLLFFNRQIKTVFFPDLSNPNGSLVHEGTLALAEGLSSADPSRAPQSGESFYLQVTYSQDDTNVVQDVNAQPTVSLPSGLTIDDSLPLRCAAVIPPRTELIEYTPACQLAQAEAGSYTITAGAGLNFRMSKGSKWVWLIPVRAAAPIDAATASVTLEEIGAGHVGDVRTTLTLGTVVGDPDNPIWQACVAAPRVSAGTYGNVDTWGAPSDLPRPYGNAWIWAGTGPTEVTSATDELFHSLVDPSSATYVYDTPDHGIHVVGDATIQHALAYYGDALGPAISDSADAPGKPALQLFAGGEVWHDPATGQADVELTYAATATYAIEYQTYIDLEGNFSWWPFYHDNDVDGVQPGASIDALRARTNFQVIPYTDVCVTPASVIWGTEVCMSQDSPDAYAGWTNPSGALPMTGVKIRLAPDRNPGDSDINLILPWKVCYTAHFEGSGWAPESCDGAAQFSPILPIDAIRIRVQRTAG